MDPVLNSFERYSATIYSYSDYNDIYCWFWEFFSVNINDLSKLLADALVGNWKKGMLHLRSGWL